MQKILEPEITLTGRQHAVLEYVMDYFIENRQYPTNREICEGCAIQSTNPTPLLTPLLKKGLLTRIKGTRRNLRLTEAALDYFKNRGKNINHEILSCLR